MSLVGFYFSARFVYKIVVLEDGSIQFRGLLRRTRLAPHDIVAIRSHPLWYGDGVLRVACEGGPGIVMSSHTQDLHHLLTWIRDDNPGVDVWGA